MKNVETLGKKIYERDIVSASLRYLRRQPLCKAMKRASTTTRRGEPDITGCLQGIRFEIECKVPGKGPTELQAKRLREWKVAGAVTGVSHSLTETKDIVAKIYAILERFKPIEI